MKKTTRIVLLLAASAGFASVSTASPDTVREVQVMTVAVKFDAVEAQTQAGVAKIFHRLRQAADSVCRTSSFPVGHDLTETRACEAQAVARSIQAANIPALTDYYFGKPAKALLASR